jgi:hypothetical protein
MQTPLEFDGGLYHFQAIRWINEARITPGLGNLHGRLAFNSAFYPFVAALNLPPLFGHGRALANSFLCLAVLAQILHHLHEHLRLAPGAPDRGTTLAHLLALPLVGYLAVTSLGLASPSADLASAFGQIALFLLLVRGIEAAADRSIDLSARIATLGLLATALVTIKLSNLGFAAGVIALIAARCWHARPPVRPLRALAAVAAALGAIWVTRGYVMSGYPCYPSTVGGLNFDWTVPAEQARHDADVVFSWARQPWASKETVLGNSQWIGPWLQRAWSNFEGIVAPVGLALLAAAAALGLLLLRRRPAPATTSAGAWWPLAPIFSGLVFWWFTAPDPRFANALLWLLPIGALAALAATSEARLRYRPSAPVLVALAILANLHFGNWIIRHPASLRDFSTTGWQPVLPAGYTPRATASGLIVNTYQYRPEQLIWDGPRPATPDYNPRLRLRVPDQPEFGFTVR